MTKTQQALILHWAVSIFGDVALDPEERAKRFAEEAIEVLQAADVDRETAHKIVDRAYDRPKDKLSKEMGAAYLTLCALAAVHGLDLEELLHNEIMRVLSKPREHWRAKHDSKVAAGTTGSLAS